VHHVVGGGSFRADRERALECERAAVVRTFAVEEPVQRAVGLLDLLRGQEAVNDDEAILLKLRGLLCCL
jgi:hypothetical protein